MVCRRARSHRRTGVRTSLLLQRWFRVLWPDKPVGFGSEVVQYVSPDLLDVGHSEAAVVYVEAIYNVGVWGVVLVVLGLGLFVRVIDVLTGRLLRHGSWPVRRILWLTASVIATAGIADLVLDRHLHVHGQIGPAIGGSRLGGPGARRDPSRVGRPPQSACRR